jgi:hypothetical protein
LGSRHCCLELRHVRDDEVVVVDVHVPYYHLRVRDNLVRLDLPAEVLVRLGVRRVVVLSLLLAELLQVRVVTPGVSWLRDLGTELVIHDCWLLYYNLA